MCERILHKELSFRRSLELCSAPCSAGQLCIVLLLRIHVKTTFLFIMFTRYQLRGSVTPITDRSRQKKYKRVASLTRELQLWNFVAMERR